MWDEMRVIAGMSTGEWRDAIKKRQFWLTTESGDHSGQGQRQGDQVYTVAVGPSCSLMPVSIRRRTPPTEISLLACYDSGREVRGVWM